MKNKKLVELLVNKHLKTRFSSGLNEEKQRDARFIQNLNTTVYFSSMFRKGAGGEDKPKLKVQISMTPGKTLELIKHVSDPMESEKFALAIKNDITRLFQAVDKRVAEIKKKYNLLSDTDDATDATQPPMQ